MKVVLTASGMGGHLLPALRVGQQLREQGHDVFFIGSFVGGEDLLKEHSFEYKILQVHGLTQKGIGEVFFFCGQQMKAFFRSLKLLREFSVDAVCGFGGYGTFPVVLAAKTLRIPSMLHEQNVIPGRANRALVHFVEKIAISFKESRNYLSNKKIVWTGCPSRVPDNSKKKESIYQKFQLKNDKLTILVLGGSQGSQRINRVFLETVSLLQGRIDFQVIHCCGKNDHTWMRESVSKLKVPYALFDYCESMDEAYLISDCAVARAGALTVTELAIFRLPAVLIPYPFALGHQKENARLLMERHLATIIDEKEFSADLLKDRIIETLSKREQIIRDSFGLNEVCDPKATSNLVKEVVQLGH